MRRTKVLCIVTIFVAVMMISIGLVIEKDLSSSYKYSSDIYNFKIQNMAASSNMIVKSVKTKNENEVVKPTFKEAEMETSPASVTRLSAIVLVLRTLQSLIALQT